MFVFNGFHPLLFQTLVIFTLTLHSCQGRSDVVGPSQPIVAAVHDDITLPCHLQPPADAVAMTVEWTRPDPDRRFVLVRRDGEELRNKHESYEGRTSLFTEELKNGNVSLRLVNVRPSDGGTYRCFVPGLDRAAAVKLVVGSVSSPVIHVTTNTSDVLVLECESAGWFPEPELLWLDAEGNLLSAGPTETVRGSDDLYTVSSRVTVEKRHSSRYTCRVQQTDTNHTSEAHIHVTGNIFPGQTDSRSSSGSSVLVIIGLILCIMFLLAAALVVWKRRKNRLGKKQQDEETQNKSGANEAEKEPLMETEPDGEQVTTQTLENQNEMKKTQTVKHLQTEEMDDKSQRRENNSRSKETENEMIETNREQFRAEREENQNKTEETIKHLQTQEMEAEDEDTHDQDLMDEEQHKELMVERETLSDVDVEMEKLKKKLKSNERDEKRYDKYIIRKLEQIKAKEKQIREIKKQLEEMETQREETEKKKMDPGSQEEAAKKLELQKQLEKTEEKMKTMMKEVVHVTEQKHKTTSRRDETVKKIKELKKQKNKNLNTTSDNRLLDQTNDHKTDKTQEAAENKDTTEQKGEKASSSLRGDDTDSDGSDGSL